MQRGIEPRRKATAIPPPDSIDVTRTALLLDVDGTLLDIAATPAGVVVSSNLRSTLSDLLAQSGGAVALVSGRTIDTLDRLFAPLKAPAIGGHGAEMRPSAQKPALKRRPVSITDPLRRRLHALAVLGANDRYLRSLFTAGALAAIRYAKLHGTKHRPWLMHC